MLRYDIAITNDSIRKVWCDMSTDGGGYTYYPCNEGATACPSVYQTTDANGCTAIGLSMVIPRSLGHWTRLVIIIHSTLSFSIVRGLGPLSEVQASYDPMIDRHDDK